MRVLSCIAACLVVAAYCAPAAAHTRGTATAGVTHTTAATHLQLVANGSPCRRACKSRYVCAGAYSTLKQACLDDRKACMAACK